MHSAQRWTNCAPRTPRQSICSRPVARRTCPASQLDGLLRWRAVCRSCLRAVQTVRPDIERFYQSLSDEQKARFNAIAPAGDPDAAGKDQRDLTKFCDEKAPGVTDLPIDRIAQTVQPTSAQRAALDELRDASVKA